MPDNRYYYFKDAKGNRHTVNKAAFDNDREGFAKAFPGARMEVIDRKTGRRGDVDVKDAGRVGDFGAHLFTGQTVRREKYQPKTSLGKAALRVAQKKWGKEESGAEPGYASLSLTKPLGNEPHGASLGLTKPLAEGGKESALVKGLREADALKRRDEEQMPIDYTKPSAVKQMVGRTRREQQTLDRRIEQAGREAGKDVMKPLREKEARLKTPVVDTGDANVNAHVINTQEQAERQLVESGLEFANKHLDDYVSDNILNEFKTATAKGAAAESALSKASPFAYMAAGKAYNEALDPDKLLKHLQEKANADIAKVLSQPKMQEEIGLKASAYGISPEEYVEKSLIPGLQTKLAADFDKSELSRSMPKSTAEYILRGVNESMLGTIMSMGMTSKKQRQYAQQGMAMTDNGENPDVNPGMAARVARGTLGFVADAPVFGAAGKAGAAVAGKVFGNGVAQTARIANSTLGGRIARMAGSGMVSQGVTGVLYGSTNAAVQNYSTGDDTSIGNTVKLMAMGGLSEGASWATMGGIGGAVGAGIYNVSGVKRIPAKAFQLAMEGIGMHMGGNVAKTIEGHDTDWLSVEGNLEACANVVALKLTHARLPKRQEKDGVKESYLDVVARNIKSLMTSDGQRAAFGGYTFTNEEKEQLFGSASAPKRNESIYGYDVHDNPLTRKESLTSWAMRAKKTAAKGKGEKDTDAEFVKTAYDEIMADNTIPWDTKAKFSALVMGTVPSERPMMENCRIEGGSVNEYSKNGELLSKNSFKSIDERNSIIYSLNMKREDQRLSNAYGAAQIKDEKTAQATLEAVAEANGMTAEQLKAAMDKQPLRRSEEEQNACVALRKAYEDEQFVPGTLHAEQSNTEGKDVVEENGLGTETPNNEAASEVLGDLTKTEDALQAAMDGNDVLKEEYERMQKAGMSNPQIYMELFNSGLTQEQLAPLADYINALSKAQGMFKGTQDKIVETTQKHVGQWSYKGELNGEKQNGEQMVFVKDDKGRALIVGAGDVAFDGEGRVRDGDMLTVYDPATREMDFVHAKDVTLERTASSEEYAKDYQRQLEELNSEVYAAMQQDSKPNEASLSQTKPGEQPVGEEGNEALLGLTKPLGEKETIPVGEKETTPVGEEPVATFADGTPVPMIKDSKGRETADYSQMSPEQGAEWMSSQFGENAEAAVDGQIKRAEKTLKDAEKIKVDYTGDLNDAKEAEAQKTMAVDAAKKELELYTNIKKAMTEKKVKAGMEKVSSVGGVGEVGSVGSVGVAREKFESGLRVVGNKRTRTLADGSKLRGHYEIVEADSLTPSHNANDGYKKSEGFPVNEEGRTINDRDYENDKQAQLVTDMIAMKYDGQAVDQVPVVTSDGIVVDGNGRTMAGQKAAKNGTDSAYIEALKENAENYGFTAEQIEQSGIKHPRLVLVSDEPMKYDTATFAKFNKNEKKAQGNTQQAVANSKKLSTDEIGTIISEIEGSGSLDAFFNNPSAINSLLTRLVDKGVIGLNEVAGLREGEDKLSAAGKDFVKNLLLGSVFSENTIRMMGADAMLKTKALNGIRAVTDNMKLGDYALMKEIDQAVQLLYEARQGGSGVDAYLRTPAMFGENAADRYDPISQAIALALEGKVEDFRELMMAYNRNAAHYADASQAEMFGERPTKEEFVKEFLKFKNWKDYETRHSSKEGNGDAGSSEGTEPQARGGSEPTEGQREVDKAVKRIATEITKKTGIEVVTDEKTAEEVIRESEETDSNLKYHKETDEATLEELENGETVKVYRAMQVIDGKLYPPMAAAVNGKRVEANELGTWIRADENPDLAIPDIDPKTKEQKVDKKTGELKWKFKLDKGGKDATGKKATDIPAAYNPYWHTSRSPLNDQFKSAWIRPNIVVVECEVPVSELSSGYRAERAKDAVGEVDWKSGVVSGEVYKQTGRARKVILSRWCKPVRVLSDAEVAQRAKEFVGDAKVEIPENVLTPRQRIEFEKAGFKIGAPEKGVKKSDQILEALKRGLQIDNEIKEHRSRWAGGEVVGMKQLPDKLHTDPDMLWNEISQYHGDYITRKLEKVPEDGTVKFFSAHDGKWYFYSVDKNHTITLFDAVEASKENYELFKDKLKKYGFDGTTKAVRDDMQETGYTGRTNSDKLESFIRPGLERGDRLGNGRSWRESGADRRGMAGETDGTQLEGNSEKQGEVKYFRTANGEVYGFTDGEKIYLDTKKMKPETPLHEYAHLWCDMLRKVNPKEWESVKKLFDKVEGLKEEVQKLYPELEGDALYEEMITTYSGREGTKKLEDVVRKLAAEEGKSVTESAKAQGFLAKVKDALTKYWKGVADVLGIHFTTAEEVADKVLADWAKGVDPRGSKEANGEGGNKPDYASLGLTEPVGEGGNKASLSLTKPTKPLGEAEGEREAAAVRLQKADGYSEFADKHGLDDIWLARYAEAMEDKNPGAANTALSNLKVMYLREHTAEKKALMEREGVHGLIANKRLFEPIRNAIKEQYGDVDVLVEEHRKQVEQKNNMMEAARKKAEEEERKRQARLEELAELTDEEIDNRYAEALAKGDEAAAREMLDEAARRKDYGDADSDYQGVGAWSAPSKPDYETDEARRNAVGEDSPDLNVEDMAAGYNNQLEDIFVHPNKYSQGLPTSEESGKAIQTAIDDIRNGKKDVKVKVYRAVPTSVKEGKLRNGDWVTPSKQYAEIHGDNRLDGKYRIIEDEVPASELWWDGNDVNEWGYDNGKSYRYKNVKNSRKLNDLVTRDDKGNVIPPSKRFNQRKADERYQRGVGGVKPSKAEVALRDAVIDRLRENGMDVIADEAEGQRVLDEANGKVREMSFGEAYDYDAYPLGRVEPNLAEKEVAVVEADVNHGFANYKEAKAWAKQHVSKVYNNEESGGKGDVRISNAAIDKFMSQSAIDKSDSKDVHMAVLKVLPEVLKTSIDVETHPDFLKGEDGKRRAENGINKDVLVHRCYGAVSIDGKPYRVKITLKEEVRNKKLPHNTHSYEATKIELLAGQHGDVTMTSPRNSNSSKQIEQRRNMVKPEGDNPNTNNSISAAKLLENVEMSYNPNEKVLNASKKRSDGIRFFRTASGEAYGFTVGGKIYIDPRIATSETPVHEYAHLWAEALRNGNPKEWQNVVELMKDTKVWDEVKARYPELKSDSEIADELIATYSGRRGAERLRAEERKITESNSGVYEKIKTIGAFEKVKMSLDKFWKCVADFLHIRYTSAEEVADRVMKDLLDGVDPRKMGKTKHVAGEEGKPRLQFIGEKGAAEADHAEEVSVRLDNLSVARDMEAEKKDAKAIKMATGWERGADGKWRYEIADMKEFDRNGNLLYRKHHPDYARYIELQDKELKNLFEDGEELTDKEREEYEALSKKYESDKFGGEKLDNIHTLEAYVDAPELFKAYPELRNVRMTFMDTGGDEIASYHHISSVFGVDKDNVGEIVVNTGKVSVNTRTNEVKSAVLHEMQHAIQDMEGFAMGGNTERMKSDFLEAKAEWAARAYAHELEETAKALGEDYDQLGVERALIKEYEDMDMSDELPDKDTRIKGFNYFARGYADRSLDDAIKRFRLNESTRGDFNPYIEYSRLAGEVEARNVQKRMDMSAEERRASLAAETEDVSREDQIFLTRNGVDKPHWASISLSKPRGGTENAKPLEGRIAETVEKVSKQTGGKVKMVNSVEEIGNEQVRRDIENGKQVTGWYDENTGEVRLYMPNIHDSYTAEKTVWHETVGHKGMRGLLGDKFNDYMRGLWMDLDNPVNAELRAYVKERMSKDSMGFYDAIEEFIAESAEKGKGEPGFWNYIKNKVTDALHEIGYRISPNVKDVKYMLWLAKNVQKKGDDPWWKMRADAVKWKIEHENVEYTKIHGGEFYENDGKSHDFEDMTKEEWDEATDGQIHYRTAPSAATALDRYHSMLNAHGYMATEAFMDNMLSLEKLMKAVDPSIKKIEDVKSSMNPYILQNTMQGAMSDKMTLFEHQVMKPLDKAMSDVLDSFAGKNTEEKIRECNLYMIGKHGLERNRVLFVRDWFRKMEKTEDVDDAGLDNLDKVWKGERSDLRRKLDSGQIDLREYYRQMDEWIVQNIDKDFKAEEHDYSGMHGLQEIDDLKSPYDDAGAIDSVMSQEAKMENQKKGSVDNLWKRIKDATNYSVYSDYENGLISEELRDHVTGMFDWYVPLRKYDEATAEDIYGYISGDDGKGFIGETLMSAKGRKSLSDVNVLAQIGAMGNRAIRNGGQNAVKQAFARFVRNSGMQNLVKETKVWVEKKGTDMNGNDIWEEAYPQIPDNASAHDIATIVDAFETDMKTKQAKGEAKTLSNSTDIGFKFARAKNKSEHFVDVKIAGRTHRFIVLGNPRAAQALNGMLENSSPKSALLKWLKSTTRFMAQMATSYSPEFVMRNIIRDAEFASSNVTAKEGVRYGLKWARYYAELNPLNIFYNEGAGALKNLKWKDMKEGVGIGLYARYREGTLGDSKMERYFKEFMQNGGETGWVQVKTMQEWEKEYKRDVSRERSNVSKAGKMLRDVLVGNVENLNEVAENMARFATFCTSRDLGRSAVRSAYDAKQVSTNFNRHGSGDAIKTFKNGEMGASKEMRRNVYGFIASYLRNYSMFFNAGVQSTHLLMSNVKKARVGTVAAMMAMPFGLGIMAAVLNNAMIASEDEKKRKGVKDPYGELPEYIRRNNLCIYKGGGEFVTIPLAIELRAFYGLGDIAAGMTAAKNVKSTRNVAKDAVGCMSQLLPVVDFMNSATFDKEPGKELLKGVLPTAAAPFAEWWLNSDWKGAPIRREGDYTENRPAWMNAYSGTPEKLMDLNKWVNAKTNDVAPGNENMRGNSLLDEATDPAILNYIIGTIGGGAATFMTRGTGLVLKYADGREQEIETKDIPFLRSLMYTPSEQTSMARTKAKWYSYKESMEKNMSNYSMLKNKNVPLTERIRNAADRHRFEQGADYARIRIIKDAEKQMKRWNKMKRLNADDKKQVDFANKNIEMIMQKAVEQMDGISEE